MNTKMMNNSTIVTLIIILFSSCSGTDSRKTNSDAINLIGTWQLVTGTTITKGVSAITDYTKGQKMIKILNGTHFAFLKHNTNKDSLINFDAGGGTYTLNGNDYAEHLDFYNDRNWEGKAFKFKVTLKNDTLIQTGIERVEKENINRVIIEKYVKITK